MNRIFFLGGCDLEMCAIKRLLDKYGEKYVDKNLKWGAKTSQILDELEKYKNYDKIYLIEFDDDAGVLKWKNVEHIDHHNENSKRPSSFEQVADILGHKLSRFEKAVALNDKGYIETLIKAGFNRSDIKRIRKLDRKCQGVTPEEEKAAEEAKLDTINYFPYEHFSPLTDRLYMEGYRKYIVYNDNLTMFFGFDIDELKKKFKDKKFFYGGGKKGFFGIEEKINKKFLEETVEEQKKEISTHIFILPFLIDDFDKFKKIVENKGFEDKSFKIDKIEYYNEYIYFYKYVRDILYKTPYYEYKKTGNDYYIIKLLNGKTYKLKIEDISLRIFNGTVGMLSFHLNNYEYEDKDDILKINEYGRRIFPQFLDKEIKVFKTKESFLADEIVLKIGSQEIKENFQKFNDNIDISFENEKNLIPNYIKYFIGDDIDLILDDRMYVVSFYLAPKWLTEELKKDYLHNDWWYKYVFVDGNDKMCKDDEFCVEILKKSTYTRWKNFGTFWGISRYSFVGVADENGRFLMVHAKTMYFQMASLVLLYRSMIISLSYKIQNIIKNLDRKTIKEIRNESKKVYKNYLKFLNGIYFHEITPQEQGIEIYKKMLEISDIKPMLDSFDREMEELDNFIDMLEEKERNESLEFLSILGALFLPPSIILGILGMNNLNGNTNWVVTMLAVIFSFVVGVLLIDIDKIKSYFNELSEKRKKFTYCGIFIFVLIVLFLFIFGK
jgi:hypothetical protein